MSATAASTTPSTIGHSAPSPTAPAHEPSTTSTAPPATCTTKPYAPWATDSSASCTAAFATTAPTAKPLHGHTAKSLKLLDELRPWDVYIFVCFHRSQHHSEQDDQCAAVAGGGQLAYR